MKVWNDEVTKCSECLYNVDIFCKYIASHNRTHPQIKRFSETIHEDCPFNRPITKETFLLLFKDNEKYEKVKIIEREDELWIDLYEDVMIDSNNFMRIVYFTPQDETDKAISIKLYYDYDTDNQSKSIICDEIIVNNPEELKFELKRIDIL